MIKKKKPFHCKIVNFKKFLFNFPHFFPVILSYSIQLAIQYAIWDRIKDIQSHTKTQLTNLAQLLVHLITNAAQAISVLKVIEFGELDKVTLRVVRQVLLGILLGKEEICKEVCKMDRYPPTPHLIFFNNL